MPASIDVILVPVDSQPGKFGRKGTLSPANVFLITVITMQLSDMQAVVAIFLASISAIFTLPRVWNFQPFSLAL